MDIYQLLDLTISLSNRIDTHWTLFITVHLALIGGIIYVDRPLKKSEKVVAIVVYTGFALVNYSMMLNQVNFLNSLYADIIAMQSNPCCAEMATMEYILSLKNAGGMKTATWSIACIHLMMFALVILSILNDKARVEKLACE